MPVELTSPRQFATRDFAIEAFGDASCDVDAGLRNTGNHYVVVPVDDGRPIQLGSLHLLPLVGLGNYPQVGCGARAFDAKTLHFNSQEGHPGFGVVIEPPQQDAPR